MAREEVTKYMHLTTTVDQLRKRADEVTELRSRCAKLEEENNLCLSHLHELEQQSRLGSKLRLEAEARRIQIADVQLKATEANGRAEYIENELVSLKEDLKIVTREKEVGRIVNWIIFILFSTYC